MIRTSPSTVIHARHLLQRNRKPLFHNIARHYRRSCLTMKFDLSCDDMIFYSRHESWETMRSDITLATIEHLQYTFKETEKDKEKWIGEGSEYNRYKKSLVEMIKSVRIAQKSASNPYQTNCDYFDMSKFDAWFNSQPGQVVFKSCSDDKYVNALDYFEVGGLYALCNNICSVCFYTPGNSLDIWLLLKKIEPFMKKSPMYIYVYEEPCSLYHLFHHSYSAQRKVYIRV